MPPPRRPVSARYRPAIGMKRGDTSPSGRLGGIEPDEVTKQAEMLVDWVQCGPDLARLGLPTTGMKS